MKTKTHAIMGWLLITALLSPPPAAPENLPSWWPGEIPVVDGAEIAEVDHAEEKGLPSVDFKVPVGHHSPTSLMDYYEKALEELGWTVGSKRDTGMTQSITATKKSIDKRVIVTAKKPGTLFNKHKDAILLEVIVYRSIP
jgi:hypothetical protein